MVARWPAGTPRLRFYQNVRFFPMVSGEVLYLLEWTDVGPLSLLDPIAKKMQYAHWPGPVPQPKGLWDRVIQ